MITARTKASSCCNNTAQPCSVLQEEVLRVIQLLVWEDRPFTASEVKNFVDLKRERPTALLPFTLVFSLVTQYLLGLVKSGPFYSFDEREERARLMEELESRISRKRARPPPAFQGEEGEDGDTESISSVNQGSDGGQDNEVFSYEPHSPTGKPPLIKSVDWVDLDDKFVEALSDVPFFKYVPPKRDHRHDPELVRRLRDLQSSLPQSPVNRPLWATTHNDDQLLEWDIWSYIPVADPQDDDDMSSPLPSSPPPLTANWKAVVARYPAFQEVWDDVMQYSFIPRGTTTTTHHHHYHVSMMEVDEDTPPMTPTALSSPTSSSTSTPDAWPRHRDPTISPQQSSAPCGESDTTTPSSPLGKRKRASLEDTDTTATPVAV